MSIRTAKNRANKPTSMRLSKRTMRLLARIKRVSGHSVTEIAELAILLQAPEFLQVGTAGRHETTPMFRSYAVRGIDKIPEKKASKPDRLPKAAAAAQGPREAMT